MQVGLASALGSAVVLCAMPLVMHHVTRPRYKFYPSSDVTLMCRNTNRIVPRIIYLTYKTIDALPSQVIARLKAMNPGYAVRVYGDAECAAFLRDEWSAEHAEMFRGIKDGPIKADFWRACIICSRGGVYLDADLRLEMPLDEFLDASADLCTCTSSHRGHMNPILLAAPPGCPILRSCVDRMFSMRNSPYSYWGYSICPHLADAIDEYLPRVSKRKQSGIYTMADTRVQLLREEPYKQQATAHTTWASKVVLRNHNDEYDSVGHRFL